MVESIAIPLGATGGEDTPTVCSKRTRCVQTDAG